MQGYFENGQVRRVKSYRDNQNIRHKTNWIVPRDKKGLREYKNNWGNKQKDLGETVFYRIEKKFVYRVVKGKNTKRVFDVWGGKIRVNQRIIWWKKHGGKNQRWKWNTDGTFGLEDHENYVIGIKHNKGKIILVLVKRGAKNSFIFTGHQLKSKK